MQGDRFFLLFCVQIFCLEGSGFFSLRIVKLGGTHLLVWTVMPIHNG